ncbi:MAG TPA: hypothetical protein VG722_10885, partial [Tepidisphaeraceae bacterium]|nr:hypothetical protein [Tepidisphaeraceae bacterium]
ISICLAIWKIAFLWFAVVPILAAVRAIFASYRWRRNMGDPRGISLIYGIMIIPGKVAEALGVMQFFLNRLRGRRSGLIEYKGVGAAV